MALNYIGGVVGGERTGSECSMKREKSLVLKRKWVPEIKENRKE